MKVQQRNGVFCSVSAEAMKKSSCDYERVILKEFTGEG
jgi:hypothetical protein